MRLLDGLALTGEGVHLLDRLPFIPPFRRHQATAVPVVLPPHRLRGSLLAARVERERWWFGLLPTEGHKPPARGLQRQGAIAGPEEHRDSCRGGDVEAAFQRMGAASVESEVALDRRVSSSLSRQPRSALEDSAACWHSDARSGRFTSAFRTRW